MIQLRNKVTEPSPGKKYGDVEIYRDSQTVWDPEGPGKRGFGKVFRVSAFLSLSSHHLQPVQLPLCPFYALDF